VISANPSKGGDAKPPVYWNATRLAQRSYDSGVATFAAATRARPLARVHQHDCVTNQLPIAHTSLRALLFLRFERRASVAAAASFPEYSCAAQRRSSDRRGGARSQGTNNDSNNFREDLPAASRAGIDRGIVERLLR
jgi:hypothetical protein